jgi:hypothetical protein
MITNSRKTNNKDEPNHKLTTTSLKQITSSLSTTNLIAIIIINSSTIHFTLQVNLEK